MEQCSQCGHDLNADDHGRCPECGGQINEGVSFDKFMDSILVKEGRLTPRRVEEENPIRERVRRHREKPLNRITYGVKK